MEDTSDENNKSETDYSAEIPKSKRPKAIDKEKAAQAREKDETEEDEENHRKTIKYGLPSEISALMDDLLKNEDPRFTEEIYDIFWQTKNTGLKVKILNYFAKLEDPCLEDFCVELLVDPYDEKKDVVKAVFNYIQAVKTKQALPPVVEIVKLENEDYFNDALYTLGELGGSDEALFLVEYLERDDLSDAQRQTLMRTLGKMHAVETFDKIVEIFEDEDENSFVRSYAAEALGFMEKKEAVPTLVSNFSSTDPNLRQSIIKALANFGEVVEAKAAIIQGIRDEHWRVRQEAIKTCQRLQITDAVQFLIYRAKNDSEKVIKDNSYECIAKLNTKDGNDFLISQLQDKKVGDSTKGKVVEVLLKEDFCGEKEILELATSIIDDEKHKQLRYTIGKALAKSAKDSYADICKLYLESKDATTVGIGMDMYKNNKYDKLQSQLKLIADDKKANAANRNRAKKLLGIEDDEEKK